MVDLKFIASSLHVAEDAVRIAVEESGNGTRPCTPNEVTVMHEITTTLGHLEDVAHILRVHLGIG